MALVGPTRIQVQRQYDSLRKIYPIAVAKTMTEKALKVHGLRVAGESVVSFKLDDPMPPMPSPIFTDEHGRPIPKPERADFETDSAFVRAFNEYKRKIDAAASRAVYHKPKKSAKKASAKRSKHHPYAIEIANKIVRGKAVGTEYVVTQRPIGKPTILARFDTRGEAERWITSQKFDPVGQSIAMSKALEKALGETPKKRRRGPKKAKKAKKFDPVGQSIAMSKALDKALGETSKRGRGRPPSKFKVRKGEGFEGKTVWYVVRNADDHAVGYRHTKKEAEEYRKKVEKERAGDTTVYGTTPVSSGVVIQKLRKELLAARERGQEHHFFTLDGKEALIRVQTLGPKKIESLTLEDVRRIAVY